MSVASVGVTLERVAASGGRLRASRPAHRSGYGPCSARSGADLAVVVEGLTCGVVTLRGGDSLPTIDRWVSRFTESVPSA